MKLQLLGLFGSCWCCYNSLANDYIRVRSEIELISHRSFGSTNTSLNSRRKYEAVCYLGTNDWQIETTFLLNAKEYWYFDGDRTVQTRTDILRATPPSTFTRTRTRPFNSSATNVAIRLRDSPGGHPLGNLGVNIPWLAYCSASYLDREATIPLPTVEVAYTPDAFGYAQEIKRFDEAPGLPYSVKLTTSEQSFLRGLFDDRLQKSKHLETLRRDPKMLTRNDLLKFEYEVSSKTNFNGVVLPLTFSYTTYANKDKEWKPFVGGIGRTLEVGYAPRPEEIFTPAAPVKTVVDFRYRATNQIVHGIIYKATNMTEPLPITDSRLQGIFAKRIDIVSRRDDMSKGRLFFVLLVLTPLFYFAIKFLRKKLWHGPASLI